MEKINKLKKLLSYYHLDGYIVPKNDEFFSEYISENKDRLKFISNFSGSYGFALILKDKNNGIFEAEEVLAKHYENYMPPNIEIKNDN